MTTFALIICLLAADPPEDIREIAKGLCSDDPKVVWRTRNRLQLLANSDIAGADEALQEYDRRRREFVRAVTRGGSTGEDDTDTVSISTSEKFAARDFVLLNSLRRLSRLAASVKHFDDDHLARVLSSPEMYILDLVDTSVTGRDFAKLEMPDLHVLTLEGSPVTDEAVCALKLPELKVLNLIGTKVTNRALADCPATGLEALYINDTAIDREALKSLTRFPDLSDLRMTVAQFDPVLFRLFEAKELKIKRLRLGYTEAEENAAKEIQSQAPAGLNVRIYLKTKTAR